MGVIKLAKLRVSGEIINELSEKIPTYIVALNELIKNSFDANANNVIINFDTQNGILTVKDDGDGMDKNNIETLLHISKSNKKYAQINERGRYIQGSKGLGFLSVFKFGNVVTWKTKKNSGYQFTIDYNELIKAEDITTLNVNVVEKPDIQKGTIIIIKMRYDDIQILKKYLREKKNLRKILYSFNVNDFNLTLNIDGKSYSNIIPIDIENILPDRQLFQVTYYSNEEKITFKHNNHVAFEHKYKFSNKNFKVDINLIIFSLKPYDRRKIDSLFYNDLDELTPLIYVNTNLFNNYDLFNPNIMQKIKYESILNQMIGYVNIYSSNQMLDFNSDRTQFVQNKLTEDITEFLFEINRTIQTEGSRRKDFLIDFDILKHQEIQLNENKINNLNMALLKSYIKDKFYFKDKTNIELKNDKIEYSLFGKTAFLKIIKAIEDDKEGSNGKNVDKGKGTIPAKIKLKHRNLTLEINKGQINLRNYIDSATNSKGDKVDVNDIVITCEFSNCVNGILESPMKPIKEKIIYSFNDPITGNTSENLIINFIDTSIPDFNYKDSKKNVIPNPIKNGYCLDEDTSFKELVKQINSLEPVTDYVALISCAIRSIFELGAYDLRASGKYDKDIKFDSNLSLTIKNIIDYVHNKKPLLTLIDNNTKLGYKNLYHNVFISDEYEKAITLSHRGAHKSNKFLSLADLESLGIKAAYFIILINEMLKYK